MLIDDFDNRFFENTFFIKMMRLVKDMSNELGIIISSKKNVSNGMTGYSIAHIEPQGLIDR